MEKRVRTIESTHTYYVMDKVDGIWIRISDEYSDVREAARVLEKLRETHPFARLGGTCYESDL